MNKNDLKEKIKNIDNYDFDEIALELFHYQKSNLPLLSAYVSQFTSKENSILFLPISAFKTHKIYNSDVLPSLYFESSGTTSTVNSRHYISDLVWYLNNARKAFVSNYGPLSEICFLALLPHYKERSNSSLIAMVDEFIKQSKYEQSGFFLYDTALLYEKLEDCKLKNIPTILFGVSFALLDFSESYKIDFPSLIIMETGGMKGRRQEVTREELHKSICDSFGTTEVHSEYGMTELLSQAYSKGNGIFYPSSTMKIIITEINDPLARERNGKAGIVNVIDLANVDSCAFIQTEDLGILYDDGGFSIEGRIDSSDLRGCNLMVTEMN